MKCKKILINIAIILGFMLIISSNVFIQQLSNLDEIWIYNFGRCIINGLVPYKDFSIIITPLFAYISAFFLKIFGDEMIVLRFAEVMQTAFVLFMVYKVLERLKVNEGLSLMFTLGIYYLYSAMFCFDYNWAVLLFSLIILYLELKEEKKISHNLRRDLLVGGIAGATILLKQTSGIILSIIVIGYKVIEIRNKQDIKTFINIALTRTIGILIPIILFALYLTLNETWSEFIDYAILGIKTFSNNVPYTKLIQTKYILAYVFPIFLAIIVIIAIITLILKKVREIGWTKNIRTLMIFDIATAVVIFPISDRMHFAVGTICTLLTIVYLVHLWFKYGLKIESKKIIYVINTALKIIAIFVFIFYIVLSTRKLITYLASEKEQNYLKHFKYIQSEESIYKAIESIDEYINKKQKEGKEVIILDTMAAAFNIPIDKYYKNYDMFNLGNFGTKGEDGIIEDLKSRNNTIMLVKKDKYRNNWQHPEKIIEYVRKQFELIDEIEVFDVYSK